MGLAPIIQAFAGIWRHEFDIRNLFSLTFAMFLANVFFIIGYNLKAQKWKKIIKNNLLDPVINSRPTKNIFFIDNNRVFLFAIIAFIFSISATLIYGPHFTSSIVRSFFGYQFTPIESMAEYFLRPFLFFGFSFCLYSLLGGIKGSLIKISLLLLSISVFLIIGPFSGARSIIFFLYFGLGIIIFRKSMINHPIFFGGLLFLGIFASELQNVLRAVLDGGDVIFTGINYFYQGHFDGFEMFGHAIGYVEKNGIVYGSQMLGAILFWIPRTVWPQKPIGSGDFMAYEYLSNSFAVDFANFSMPLMAEAYLNFGFLGVCVIFYMVGAFCGKEDTRFHMINRIEALKDINYFPDSAPLASWRYVISLGIFLFILRGDLQSGISFLTGIFLALMSAWLFLHYYPNRKYPNIKNT